MLYPVTNHVRTKLELNGIWDFQIDPEGIGEAAGWQRGLPKPLPIAVPGSWNEQYADLYNYFDLAWYVTRAYVPNEWKGQRIFLRVGSACYLGTVYLNGEKLGWHEGGHLPFAFEISAQVRWGEENIIAISVENRMMPARVPSGNLANSAMSMFATTPKTTFDFFPFAGLHRPVVLYCVPQTHIDDISVVTAVEGGVGKVEVRVRLNEALAAQGSLALTGGDTRIEANLAFEGGAASASLSVPAARLWSCDDPYLYNLSVQTGEDHYSLKIGIRTIAVQGGQVLLNGQPVQMNGYGRHEDFMASGKGLNLPLIVKDYSLMRWTGANSYRTSHYPYSEEEMQLADREGFLIIDEIPAVSLQFDNEENMAERLRVCYQQIDELIARDKNHASVVMWSVANEPMPSNLALAGGMGGGQQDPAEIPGKIFLEKLIARARQLDPTRLVTIVTVMGGPISWMEQCDVVCMNRYWGWYILGGELDKAMRMFENELDMVWARWQRPIMLTEFGADTLEGMHGQPTVMWTEEYQADLIRGYLEVASRKPYVAGMQVWNFADFAAVQSIARVGGMNRKGIFTRARNPKLAASVLREFWTKNTPK